MEYLNMIDSESIIKFAQIGGPLVGILLPIIEAFFPILPLVLFVTINVTVFGFFFGYMYSWIGNCIGSFLLFLLIRKIGGKKIEKKINESKYSVALGKIKSQNFSVLFLLYCFPFTPSFLISGTAALANMSTKQFLVALLPSKLIMLISLAFIGFNVKSFFDNPVRSVLFVLLILLLNLVIKKVVENWHVIVVKRGKK
ncbi:TVP38/TMEM64 family protein [Sedimentibacter sp. zth1]|uniref:TVP38/TMEM64 family protein n=1 Tax=Sedimentibacter sp. zth1 TaxID=2816908 RepID=UPI001A93A441|nr:VTT domain-containing protein [Sedimentibacter sp. zth1]QSX07037.1 TVP38/TMEM64 family protein [Sedimentibacter sp. zth1]